VFSFTACGDRRNLCLIVPVSIALVIAVVSIYMQAAHHHFISYDDNIYVTANQHVASGISVDNIIWAFTSVGDASGNWHPLTWLSHMADAQFYGLNPFGHHLTNIVIHTLSSLTLLLLLFRITSSLWQSAFVAFMFALHPLHVESVAWVAERKDLLSGLFWFLTLLLYSEYVTTSKPLLYILCLFSFILGLMAKPMLVTLPLVMILVDYWPLRRNLHKEAGHRFDGVVALAKEKIPFFVCSFFSCAITIYSQHKAGAINSLDTIPIALRIENALTAYVSYIGKTFWPTDLAVLYPFPLFIPLWQVIGSLFVILFISAAALWAGRRYPYLTVGWLWFLITLLPVIGLIQVGSQSMADRYSYIPTIGLFIMAAWGVTDLTNGLRHRMNILVPLAGAVVIASAILTWQQLAYWQDSISLYQHTLKVTNGNYAIHNSLGLELAGKGDIDAAIQEYRTAIQIRPRYAYPYNNLGNILADKGDLNSAIQEYRQALRLNPNYADAHYNFGNALAKKGNLDAAIQEYREAIKIKPNHADAHYNIGYLLISKGELDAAIMELREALRLNPRFADAHYNIGYLLINRGELDAAIMEFRAALRLNPRFADAHYNIGNALIKKGNLDSAIREFQEALRIAPGFVEARKKLDDALVQKRTRERVKE